MSFLMLPIIRLQTATREVMIGITPLKADDIKAWNVILSILRLIKNKHYAFYHDHNK